MFLISYDGITFASLNAHGGLPWATARGQWSLRTLVANRRNALPVITGAEVMARSIPAQFVYEGADPLEEAIDALLGALQPMNPTPRTLVAQRGTTANPGVLVERLAVVELDNVGGGFEPNVLPVRFVSADPVWYETTITTSSLLDAFNPSFATDLTGWAQGSQTSGLTVSVTRDADVWHDAPGSLSMDITANSAGANAIVAWRNTNYLPAVATRTYAVQLSALIDDAGDIITPQVLIEWYNAGQTFISNSTLDSFPSVVGWQRRTHVVVAPALTAFARVHLRALIPSAGDTGTIWFDDVRFAEAMNDSSQLAYAVTNGGQAPAHATIRLTVTGVASGASLVNRRRFTIHNGLDWDLDNWPYRLDLGDTSGWDWSGSGHASAAAEFYLFRDGQQVAREPVNLDSTQSYLWFTIDGLSAGESAQYTIAYNTAIVGEPPLELTGIGNVNRPAFDIAWETGDVSSATATTLTVAGSPWQTNEWQLGYVELISGTGSGPTEYQVVSNTTNQLTVSGWSAGTPNSTTDFLLVKSRGTSTEHEFLHDLRQVERSDPERGLWYTSGAGQSPPQEVRFDTPGSWYLGSLVGNNDERVAKEVTPFNPGGTTDYVAGLDVNRTWQGGSSYGKGAKKHDAVFFDSPVPITSLRANFLIKNPNGMAKGFIGAKEGAGADYEAILEHTTASDTLTAITATTYTMPADTHHLAIGLIPRNDQEIPLSWSVDEGTLTSATSTTGTDATKLWETGQWEDAVVRIVSGTGAGGAATITASTPNGFTVASWPNGTPDSTSRYQIRQKSNDATFRHEATDPQFRLILDTSGITISEALTAEEDNVLFAGHTFALDSEDLSADRFYSVSVGGDRRVLLTTGDELRIDCFARRVTLHEAGGGQGSLHTLGGGYVRADLTTEDSLGLSSERLAGDWLPLTPGAHEILSVGTVLDAAIFVEWTSGWFGG